MGNPRGRRHLNSVSASDFRGQAIPADTTFGCWPQQAAYSASTAPAGCFSNVDATAPALAPNECSDGTGRHQAVAHCRSVESLPTSVMKDRSHQEDPACPLKRLNDVGWRRARQQLLDLPRQPVEPGVVVLDGANAIL